jgi:radical SAM protein with 4Fe4S-binding SPASM domain
MTITNRYVPYDDAPCKIAGLVGIIAADANMYYCCQTRGMEKYKLGNLDDKGFLGTFLERDFIEPDFKNCVACRYMNYAEEYKKFTGKKFKYLRHREFI